MEDLDSDLEPRKNYSHMDDSSDDCDNEIITAFTTGALGDDSSTLCREFEALRLDPALGFTSSTTQPNRNGLIVSDHDTSQFFYDFVPGAQRNSNCVSLNQKQTEQFMIDVKSEKLYEIKLICYQNVQYSPSLEIFSEFHLEEAKKAYFSANIVKGYSNFLSDTLRNKVRVISTGLTENTNLPKVKLINYICENANTFQMYSYEFNKYKKNFCKFYYIDPIVAESYDNYVTYLFSYSNCGQLSKIFNKRCCIRTTHSDKCLNFWSDFEADKKGSIAATIRGPKEMPP